jgi:putative flippase GtrA
MLRSRIVLGRFLVYAMVGAAGTAGHYAFLVAAVSKGWMTPVTASMVGALFGALINFVLNAFVTFRSRPTVGRAARFFATAALAAAGNGVLMSLLLANLRVDYRVAQLFVTGILLCLTFCIHSVWTFRIEAAR